MGIQAVAGEIRSPEPNLLSLFSHFLTLVGIEYPLKAPKSFFQALSFSITWLGLPGSLSTHLLPVSHPACTQPYSWLLHRLVHSPASRVFSFLGQDRGGQCKLLRTLRLSDVRRRVTFPALLSPPFHQPHQ